MSIGGKWPLTMREILAEVAKRERRQPSGEARKAAPEKVGQPVIDPTQRWRDEKP